MVKHLIVYTGGSEAAFYQKVAVAVPATAGACGTPTVHPDGTIAYPAGSPPEITGYKRVGERCFRPAWPSCRWRSLLVDSDTGCITIAGKCQYPLSVNCRREVLPQVCEACGHRDPIN